jgi:alkylation response protein AidB-like acyl-CoA dehydrogenase
MALGAVGAMQVAFEKTLRYVEYDIERAARDARLGPIGGGTDEIMNEILGRSLGL